METSRRRDLRPDEIDENKEDLTLVWLDGNIDDSPASLHTQMRLRNVINYCQFYTDTQLGLDFMRTVNNEKILLVVSEILAHSILPQIHSLRSIDSVFICCCSINIQRSSRSLQTKIRSSNQFQRQSISRRNKHSHSIFSIRNKNQPKICLKIRHPSSGINS